MEEKIVLSGLGHTWILDLDGTFLKHNGYRTESGDTFLPGAKDFLNSIPLGDMVIFVTSRTDEYREVTLSFLKKNSVRFDSIIFNAPYGERILINDDKPSGLEMVKAVRTQRDEFPDIKICIDNNL